MNLECEIRNITKISRIQYKTAIIIVKLKYNFEWQLSFLQIYTSGPSLNTEIFLLSGCWKRNWHTFYLEINVLKSIIWADTSNSRLSEFGYLTSSKFYLHIILFHAHLYILHRTYTLDMIFVFTFFWYAFCQFLKICINVNKKSSK